MWRSAAELAPAAAALLSPGARVAIAGWGTSFFIARAAAAVREAAGQGETEACVGSEMPTWRRYDRVLAISRSAPRRRSGAA